MKFAAFFAALLLAFTSIAAEASASCADEMRVLSTDAMIDVASHDPACDERSGKHTKNQLPGCSVAAFCALLCGVVPPADVFAGHGVQLLDLKFAMAADAMRGALQKPPARPPRRNVHRLQ